MGIVYFGLNIDGHVEIAVIVNHFGELPFNINSIHFCNAMQRITSAIMTAVPKRVPISRNGVDYRGKIVLAPMVQTTTLLSLK